MESYLNLERYLTSLGIRGALWKAARLASEQDLFSKEDLLEAIGSYAEGLVTTIELHDKLTSSLPLRSVDAAKLAIAYCESIRPVATQPLGFTEDLRLHQASHHRCSGCVCGEGESGGQC